MDKNFNYDKDTWKVAESYLTEDNYFSLIIIKPDRGHGKNNPWSWISMLLIVK